MTGVVRLTGATPSLGSHWKSINWTKVKAEVKRLQMRIAKAVREGKPNKVRCLQWILSHSHSAKLTPLGIPTLRDRAMQALYLSILEPIAETQADPNSYGFRYYRACRDAIAQCFCSLAKSYSPKWILDADINACFDWIDHDWLMDNIPIDKRMLRQWLKCGYFQNRKLFPTQSGTPQGGIISPTLANMTLDGLERTIKESCPRRRKVNFIRYADDFIVTADSRELLEENIIPAINEFLKPRGLRLSAEKTRIVRIEQGFDFPGQQLQKYRNKLIITPSKDNTRSFLSRLRETIRSSHGWKTEEMIKKLNPMIRGWAYYHRYVQFYGAFSFAEGTIFQSLWRWIKRRHPQKSCGWIIKHYFNNLNRKWVFSCWIKDRKW